MSDCKDKKRGCAKTCKKSAVDKFNKFKLQRRIAHEGYPLSEARFNNILEYILYLEEKVELKNKVIGYYQGGE